MSWAGPNGNNNPFNRPGGPQGLWNFIHSLDPNMRTGAGVDHSAPWANLPAGFPFHGSEFGFGGGPGGGPGGWGAYGGWGEPRRGFGHRRGGGRFGSRGPHGSRGRRGMNEADEAMQDAEENVRDAAEESGDNFEKEKNDSPDTMRDSPEEGHEHRHEHGHHCGPGRRGRGRHGRGPSGENPWRHGRGHHHGPHGPHGPRGPPPFFGPGHPQPPPHPPYNQSGGFDLANLQEWLNQFAGHPLAQQIREWTTRFGGFNIPGTGPGDAARGGPDFAGEDASFTPPVDVFATDKSYILHFALPGAKKEDIGVDWDAEKGELRVAGVVYRPGDEDFLATMASSERRIGMFSRSVPLPPPGADREEIDALSITAKMEDGILIVTVPKLEKEWTEIHKVDIE